MTKENEILIEVKGLKKYFPLSKGFSTLFSKKKFIHAVDGVDFNIRKGETLSLVGESGCGKTTVARTLLRIYEPTAGQVLFEGEDIYQANRREMKRLKRNMQYIFQDPYASLDPTMTIGKIVEEPLKIHGLEKGNEKNVALKILEDVGLDSQFYNRYPHELSGGQRQRVGIARALIFNPKFIAADEPVSALDVSVRAQILKLMYELQQKYGLTYLFIAHDLSVVKYVSDRVAVMYLGKIVELADTESLYNDPLHPYTKALFSVIPIPNPEIARNRVFIPLEGEVPSPINLPPGCRFNTRCSQKIAKCDIAIPELIEKKKGHQVACHLVTKKEIDETTQGGENG